MQDRTPRGPAGPEVPPREAPLGEDSRILADLYISFFIFDRSEDMGSTKKFLDKQIDLVLSFGKLKQKLKNKISI